MYNKPWATFGPRGLVCQGCVCVLSRSVMSDSLQPHGLLPRVSQSVQLLNHGQLFGAPRTAAYQASLSITNSRSLLKLKSIESVMPSNHLILCHPLLLLPSIFPSIWVSSKESALHIKWPKHWSFSFSISPSDEYSGYSGCQGQPGRILRWGKRKYELQSKYTTRARMWKSFPGGASGEEPSCQYRRCKKCGFDPWVGKIPWRREWLPTPVFLPGEFPGQRNLAVYCPWGCKELDTTEGT